MAERRDDQVSVVTHEEISDDHDDNSKRFDAFFSYNEKDSEIVTRALEELEQPPYSLKICYHKRDFEIGATIIDNIEVCMRQSKKVVLFLSKSFVKSEMCNLERQLAVHMNVSDMKKTIVPVLLEHCDIPPSLGFLTYLDWTENSFSIEHLAKALKEKQFVGSSFKVQSTASERFINGEIVCKLVPQMLNENEFNEEDFPGVLQHDSLDITKQDFEFDEEDCPDVLQHDSIDLTKHEYQKLIHRINQLPFIQSRRFKRMESSLSNDDRIFLDSDNIIRSVKIFLFSIFLYCTLLLLLSFAHVLVFAVSFSEHLNYLKLLLRQSFYPFVPLFCIVVYYFRWYIFNPRTHLNHQREEVYNTIHQIIKHTCQKHLIIYYSPRQNVIVFMFFKSADCHKFLAIRLLKVCQVDDQIALPDTIQSINALVKNVIEENVIFVYLSRKNPPGEIRHTKQGLCICQYLERTLLKDFLLSKSNTVHSLEEGHNVEETEKIRTHLMRNLPTCTASCTNGHTYFMLFAQQSKISNLSTGLKFDLCHEDIPEVLTSSLSKKKLETFVGKVEGLPYFKYFNIVELTFSFHSLVSRFLLFICMYVLSIVSFFIYFGYQSSQPVDLSNHKLNETEILAISVGVLAVILTMLISQKVIPYFVHWRHNFLTKLLLQEANKTFMSDNLACHIVNLKIIFFRLVIDPCRPTIKEIVQNRSCTLIENQLHNLDKMTDDFIIKNLFDYLDYRAGIQTQGKLIPDFESHTLFGKCFCAFVLSSDER